MGSDRPFHSLREVILQPQCPAPLPFPAAGGQTWACGRLSFPLRLPGCACLLPSTMAMLYSSHRVPPEKRDRPGFPQRLYDLKHYNSAFTLFLKNCIQGHLSAGAHRLPLLWEGCAGCSPRKGHAQGMGGKPWSQRVSALPNKVKLVAVQERSAIYTHSPIKTSPPCMTHILKINILQPSSLKNPLTLHELQVEKGI
uniref:Uncharacterized protein n=1 Tax=Pipistrellus kuhlii TaxID=59472 RepID=A0A7J7ZJI4_PIPKU|nr:hypothetical protein mPipKuh1_009656 [Pipistrellus kuhlii]